MFITVDGKCLVQSLVSVSLLAVCILSAPSSLVGQNASIELVIGDVRPPPIWAASLEEEDPLLSLMIISSFVAAELNTDDFELYSVKGNETHRIRHQPWPDWVISRANDF